MIVVTGGAGFIGSNLVWRLNRAGIEDILIVDRLGHGEKWKNLSKRSFQDILHKDEFLPWLSDSVEATKVTGIFHLGACSSTTETDADYLINNNLHYSMALFRYCAARDIPFFYASSAATYGEGEHGFSDRTQTLSKLRPINPYGFSKHLFDRWALAQSSAPLRWAGFKFFNVYGPQEYHKGAQASVVLHAKKQIQDSGRLKLFKSYKEGIAHGEQQRDFIYVKDVVDVLWHFFEQRGEIENGIYNVGTGKARSFADLGRAVFKALRLDPKLEWIEMPEAIRGQYQYFTEADMEKLKRGGRYKKPFTSVEDGVRDYVQSYLIGADSFL